MQILTANEVILMLDAAMDFHELSVEERALWKILNRKLLGARLPISKATCSDPMAPGGPVLPFARQP